MRLNPAVVHPAICLHPELGRPALSVNARIRTFSGKSDIEMIAPLKSPPSYYIDATISLGTGQHLSPDLFKNKSDVDMSQVCYTVGVAAFPNPIGGRTPIMFQNKAVMVPHVKSGALRVLAITCTRR